MRVRVTWMQTDRAMQFTLFFSWKDKQLGLPAPICAYMCVCPRLRVGLGNTSDRDEPAYGSLWVHAWETDIMLMKWRLWKEREEDAAGSDSRGSLTARAYSAKPHRAADSRLSLWHTERLTEREADRDRKRAGFFEHICGIKGCQRAAVLLYVSMLFAGFIEYTYKQTLCAEQQYQFKCSLCGSKSWNSVGHKATLVE